MFKRSHNRPSNPDPRLRCTVAALLDDRPTTIQVDHSPVSCAKTGQSCGPGWASDGTAAFQCWVEDPLWWRFWEDAENVAAAVMFAIGFHDASVTPSGADGGLDVVSTYAAAQVKAHQKVTGRPDVQKLNGAAFEYGHRLFFSTAGYNSAAIRFADRAGVSLFVLHADATATAANTHAAVLVSWQHQAVRQRIDGNSIGPYRTGEQHPNVSQTWAPPDPRTRRG